MDVYLTNCPYRRSRRYWKHWKLHQQLRQRSNQCVRSRRSSTRSKEDSRQARCSQEEPPCIFRTEGSSLLRPEGGFHRKHKSKDALRFTNTGERRRERSQEDHCEGVKTKPRTKQDHFWCITIVFRPEPPKGCGSERAKASRWPETVVPYWAKASSSGCKDYIDGAEEYSVFDGFER